MITPQQVAEAAAFLRERLPLQPKVAVVLGTGLNHLVQYVQEPQIVAYEEIPHFPRSTVSFHKGQLISGRLEGVPVLLMQGRFHYYEGYRMDELTLPVRVFAALGAEALLLSNAAGGLNPSFRKGDLIITDDHINLLPDNPLRGPGEPFGNRFVDMSAPYHPRLQALLETAFADEGVEVKKGVYVSVMGPNLETRAEYRWLRSMGADCVGMSTVPEVIVAGQCGLPCAAVSVITDECDPDHLQPVNIAEIIEVAGKADQRLSRIFIDVVAALGRSPQSTADGPQ